MDFDKHIPVIILTGHGNIETAVDMMRLGAYDFMTKPFNLDKMLLIIARALESKNIKKTNESLERRVDYHESFYGMIGHSSKMLKVYEAIKQVARTKATVLIEGESGTGKELVANAIHKISDRANQPYITVNCAALSEGVFWKANYLDMKKALLRERLIKKSEDLKRLIKAQFFWTK